MQICKSLEELQPAQDRLRQQGKSLALIPTMGALHEGHLSLVKQAQQDGHATLATLFVNPTQFAAHEDLDTYPQTFEPDVAALQELGVNILFAPSPDLMYPDGDQTRVRVGNLGKLWEGVDRPHFFEGVATVVTKLLILAKADAAYFGEKDFQQLQVIRRLATDLIIETEIHGCPTIRDAMGLALSSRNAYLDEVRLQVASNLYQTLIWTRDQIQSGAAVPDTLDHANKTILDAGFETVSYLAHIDADTLEAQDLPLSAGSGRLIVAAYLGGVRLIDNIAI